MHGSIRFAAGVLLSVVALSLSPKGVAAEDPSAAGSESVSPVVSIHWNTPEDTSSVHAAAPGDSLDLYVTITGVDTLMGFQVEVRVIRDEASTAWRFLAREDCPAALLDAVAEGTRTTPAPWRSKLFLSDARAMESGRSRLVAVSAFHEEPLDAGSSYTLCRFRLVPPRTDDGSCVGWDSDARFEVSRAEYLHARRQQRTTENFGKPLTLRLQSAN
jgi:hypothetical protein